MALNGSCVFCLSAVTSVWQEWKRRQVLSPIKFPMAFTEKLLSSGLKLRSQALLSILSLLLSPSPSFGLQEARTNRFNNSPILWAMLTPILHSNLPQSVQETFSTHLTEKPTTDSLTWSQ